MLVSQLLATLLSLGVFLGCAVADKDPKNYDLSVADQNLEFPYPYYFPLLQNGSDADSGQFPMPLCKGFKLEEATIDQLQTAMQHGQLTSVDIIHCYMKRIDQTDQFLR